MPKICYEPKKFSADNLRIVELSEQICMAYATKGYDLTLRQLYYQLVTRNTFPNTEQSYKRLGSIVSDARRAGLIDWDHIVDRTRNLRQASGWESEPSCHSRAAAGETGQASNLHQHPWGRALACCATDSDCELFRSPAYFPTFRLHLRMHRCSPPSCPHQQPPGR